MALLMDVAVAPGASVAQIVVRFGMSPLTPARLQSIVRWAAVSELVIVCAGDGTGSASRRMTNSTRALVLMDYSSISRLYGASRARGRRRAPRRFSPRSAAWSSRHHNVERDPRVTARGVPHSGHDLVLASHERDPWHGPARRARGPPALPPSPPHHAHQRRARRPPGECQDAAFHGPLRDRDGRPSRAG